jgi:hypothetical protein
MRGLSTFLVVALGGCSPYCLTSLHVVLSDRPGLRTTATIDTSAWRRLHGARGAVSVSYEYQDNTVRVFLRTPVLASGSPALWIDSVLASSGERVFLKGTRLHPGYSGTDLAYYFDMPATTPSVVKVLVLDRRGRLIDTLIFAYEIQPHARTCGVETL